MKTKIQLRGLAVVLLAGLTLTAMAQSDVRVGKALRMQKVGGKTLLKSTDNRLPLTVAKFDHEVDYATLPQEVRDFLSSYDEALRQIDNGSEIASVLSVDPSASYQETTVGPLLGAIEFDQDTPYNNHCPVLNNGRAVTGCVATAMAQIMTYWKYPSVGVGSTTYTSSTGAQTFNFPDHPFEWKNILDTYTPGNYTAVQANAIAELMLACGASVNMNYSSDGSGADSRNVAPALSNFFGYDPSIEHLRDATESIITTIWVACLMDEIDHNRPVYYAGSNQIEGHAFVIDGYQTEGNAVYFHVNWGWSGHGNGYYLITNLRPEGGTINYSAYSNDFILNIFPKGAGIENTVADVAQRVDMNAPVYTILGNKVPASSMQHGMIYIQNGRKFVW